MTDISFFVYYIIRYGKTDGYIVAQDGADFGAGGRADTACAAQAAAFGGTGGGAGGDKPRDAVLAGSDGADDALEAAAITGTLAHADGSADGYPKYGNLNGVSKGYLNLNKTASNYAAEAPIITYTFKVTAKKALRLSTLTYKATNNQSGNTQIVTSYKIGSKDAVTANTLKADNSKNFAGSVEFEGVELAANDVITFTLLQQMQPSKSVSSKAFTVGLQDVVLSVIDISE